MLTRDTDTPQTDACPARRCPGRLRAIHRHELLLGISVYASHYHSSHIATKSYIRCAVQAMQSKIYAAALLSTRSRPNQTTRSLTISLPSSRCRTYTIYAIVRRSARCSRRLRYRRTSVGRNDMAADVHQTHRCLASVRFRGRRSAAVSSLTR